MVLEWASRKQNKVHLSPHLYNVSLGVYTQNEKKKQKTEGTK